MRHNSTRLFSHIIEPDNPIQTITEDWEKIDLGLHVSIGSIDTRYEKNMVPDIEKRMDWNGVAWCGEKISAQIVLWSRDAVSDIHFEFTNFIGDNGVKLPADIAKARFVRFVLTDEFGEGNGCAERKPEDFLVSLSPDILDNIDKFDMESNSTRPVWLTFNLPLNAIAGTYKCNLYLYAEEINPLVFNLELEVLPFILPPASDWQFHLDLWQHPYAVARMYEVEVWSEEHWDLLQPLMRILANAGQKVITTTIIEKPWGNQAFDPYETMIEWKKNPDGTWEYDYTIFDRWVEFMMKIGINRQINAYSLIPWTSELVYFDKANEEKVIVRIETGSPEYVEIWSPFLIDFKTHLEEKGWLNITNLAMDEIKVDQMQLMLSVIDEIAPEFGLASADSEKAYKKYPDRIKDLTVTFANIIDKPDLEYRKSKGYLSTFYVCCREPFPNQFTFSPPVESTFIGWYSIANGFNGFLRWAYAHWVEDPLHDTRFRKWPAGDTNFVYPGPRSSIRFERLVEGIQDAEKIRILKNHFGSHDSLDTKIKLEKLNRILSLFQKEPKQCEITELVSKGKQILVELSRL
jgi:hypothetical protein